MEVPAKRARLAPREIKLLDLDDDALIMIIKKLDHKSKKQMMATCKRFERLIGYTHQFYKNFQLDWNEAEISVTPQFSRNIQRKFGSVTINGNLYKNHSSRIMEIIKRIGANVIEVQLNDLQVTDTVFLKLMKFLSDVRELTISGRSNIIETNLSSPDFKLTNLIRLESQVPKKILEVLVPASLKILKLDGYGSDFVKKNRDPNWDAAILDKQTCLEELSLEQFKISIFEFDPKNCHIKKLEIRGLSFLNQSAFKKFADFMELQESVVELELHIGNELKAHDYAGILVHLLSLKSLKKLTVGCQYGNEIFTVFSKIDVCNPTVENLIIKNTSSGADLKSLPKCFPNVSDLKITWDNYNVQAFQSRRFSVDLKPINSMKQIRKLEIDFMSQEMLVELELKEMREFRISKQGLFWHLDSWKTFIKNHSKLELLHMPRCESSLQHLLVTLEGLPLLKSLESIVSGFIFVLFSPRNNMPKGAIEEYMVKCRKEQTEKAAKLIGENYHRFEHLNLDFQLTEVNRIVLEFLENYYPGVKLHK
jgi:hypothetical protein